MDSMNITIATSSERRKRYKFLSVPFEMSGHNVDVVYTSPAHVFILKVIKKLFLKRKPDLMILLGVGVKEFMACIILMLCDCCVMVRLGGDPIRNNHSMAASCLIDKRYFDWLKHKIKAQIATVILKLVDGVIVVNPAMEKMLNKEVAMKCRVYAVHQPGFMQAVPHQYSVKDTIEVLTVTNLRYSEKAQGVIWIIDQLCKYAHAHEVELRLRVAGAGQHLRDIKQHLEVVKMPDGVDVCLEGYVDELDEFYRRADVFIYHSIHDATPNVILESKRYGIPMLVNDCEEFRFIVEQDSSGFLYKDEDQFQTQFTKIIENKPVRESLGKAAQVEYEQLYSVDSVKKILDAGVLSFVSDRKQS